MAQFSELGLKPELVTAVTELGFTQPTPIQEQAIPALLGFPRDLVGLARTGTGKTAAFGLPVLHFIDVAKKFPQALVLCPTRELCLQITEDLKSYAKHLRGVHVLAVYGGSSIVMQMKDLKRGVQVIVGTPGRLIDLIERGALKLGEVKTVVLDEADEMLNMGFREDIDTILAETPEEKCTWLFSATMPEGVARIARNYMKDPLSVSVKGTQEGEGQIDHFYCTVHSRDRYAALRRIIDAHPDIYGIVFCRTKAETQDVADHLVRDGYMADALHGDLSQAQRDHVMKRFRRRTLQMLVATDVAARGIDVDDVTHVLHYQLPDEPESYTHRSGRTGRAGKSGVSILFLHAKETGRLRELERRAGKKFAYLPVPAGSDVIKNQLLSFAMRIKGVDGEHNFPDEYVRLLKEAFGEVDTDVLLQKFIAFSLKKIFDDYANAADLNISAKPVREHRERESREPEGERHTFFLSIGRMDGVDPGDLLRVCCDQLNVGREHIGRIDLKHNFCFVQTVALEPKKVLEAFRDFSFRGRKVRVNEAENAGEGRREQHSRGWKKESFFEERKFGSKKSFGERREKSFHDKPKKHFGDRPHKPFAEKPHKKFHDKPQKDFHPKQHDDKKSHNADDWKNLMNEGGDDRRKKFRKK